MCTIIGRKNEIRDLQRIYGSGRPEFVAVYGRRRVGKTFLIDEVFRDNMTFHHTGLSPYDRTRKVSMKDQLQNFYFSLLRHGLEGAKQPKNWFEAFFLLQKLLINLDNGSRQVVFIDELPWMDSPRSKFLTALEGFWNGWGNTRHSLCLVVCGSATSWMLDNLINNKGGLYGRLTCEIKLPPFTLKECEEFYADRGIKMTRYNVLQSYMILGGIPFYMNYLNPSYSLAQNIDTLFFQKSPKLGDEFERLFKSVFDDAESCMNIIKAASKRHSGYSRNELAQMTGDTPNGAFTKKLKALMASDFLAKYKPYGADNNVEQYKLSDNFCWFWLHFKNKKRVTETDYWSHHLNESEIASWRGIAFEEVCFNHIKQIKSALGISGVSSTESTFLVKGDSKAEGMQLDLVIDRRDDVINLCEIKFYKEPFSISKEYSVKLQSRSSYWERLFPKKSVHLTLISTYGAADNMYSSVLQSKVTMDDLFASD